MRHLSLFPMYLKFQVNLAEVSLNVWILVVEGRNFKPTIHNATLLHTTYIFMQHVA